MSHDRYIKCWRSVRQNHSRKNIKCLEPGLTHTPKSLKVQDCFHHNENEFYLYNARLKKIDDLLHNATERRFAAAACIDCTRADPESSVKTQFMAFEDRGNLGSYVVGQNDVCDEDTRFLNIRSVTNRDGEICKFVIKRDILRHFSKHPVDTRYEAYGRTRRVHFTINIDSPEMANLRKS